MKKITLDSQALEDIRKGLKTTFTEVNDTQNISVDDELALQSEGTPMLIVGVDKVIEKRLGDLDMGELQDAGVTSRDEMLHASRSLVGSNNDVSFDTHVKIIHFKITTVTRADSIVVNKASDLTEIKLFADGGSRGNPGPSACGFVLMDMTGNIVVKKGIYLGITTNNQAEYQGLKLGLEAALHMQAKHVHVFMDSMLVVNQMLGIFKVKNRDLWPVHTEIVEIVQKFSKVSFTQVPRELNKLADKAVNEALNQAATNQKN